MYHLINKPFSRSLRQQSYPKWSNGLFASSDADHVLSKAPQRMMPNTLTGQSDMDPSNIACRLKNFKRMLFILKC